MTLGTRIARLPVLAGLVLLMLAPASAHAALPGDFFGFEAKDVGGGSASYRDAALARQGRVGSGVFRQLFDWSAIETSNGTFRDPYDGLVGAAARAGMRLLPIVARAPDFVTGRPSGTRGDWHPRDPNSIGPVLDHLVQRYGPSGSFWAANPSIPKLPIRAWQIWNEPHLPGFWGPNGPNASEYVQLLKVASIAIHRADPGAEVVAAGISDSTLPGAISLRTFISQMYSAGVRGAVNDIALHAYASSPSGALSLVQAVRSIMNANGDSGSKIWITEFGWASGGPPSTFTTNESGQAANIRSFMQSLKDNASSLGIRGAIYYDWRDAIDPTGFDDWSLHTGLLRVDGTDKPALQAYADEAGGTTAQPGGGGTPDTTITGGPTTTTSANSTFTFTSNTSGVHFQCRVDGSAWTACSSPYTVYGALPDAHVFEVRAITSAGAIDPTPAQRLWTVSTGATGIPDTTITGGPTNTTLANSSFSFTSNESGVHFQCRVDGSPWVACTSPWWVYGALPDNHVVEVRAIDRDGNVDPTPARRVWTVTAVAVTGPVTTITGGPTTTSSHNSSFTFTSSSGGVKFDCRVDGSAWTRCTSPYNVWGALKGDHVFEVRATDSSGHVGPGAKRVWTVTV